MLRRLYPLILLVWAVGLGFGGLYLLIGSKETDTLQPKTSVAQVTGGDKISGFARAVKPHPFSFPIDYGPHPAYRIEWWYYTGNLETEAGRHFGYQLTFFRFALTPQPAQRESAWAANQVYMAHFALTDVGGAQFHAFERFSRAAVGLAGAQAQPFKVWLENWSVEELPARIGEAAADAWVRLQASEGEVSIDLTLQHGKPVVLQGEKGLSQKSTEAGNASYYYSLTRMPTQGTIRVGGKRFVAEGLSWMDREWSTSALGNDQVGWNWFALQLSDERDVMFYALRHRDGSLSPFSRGVLVERDGTPRPLPLEAIQIDSLDHWQSPLDGARYPSRWRMRIPSESLELLIEPYLADQELNLSVRYWEGAVRVSGVSHGQPINGSGYVELTGFGASPRSEKTQDNS